MSGSLGRPVATASGESVDPRLATVLVVESRSMLGIDLVERLRSDGYRATLACTASRAHALAWAVPVRAMVLGALARPDESLDLLGAIRSKPSHGTVWPARLPVIMLSPGVGRLDLQTAFEAGADEFVAHPVTHLELRMRLAALLRRVEHPGTSLWRIGPLQIDTTMRCVRISSSQLELAPREYELLLALARRPSCVCSRRELLREVWGSGNGARVRTVDSHVSRLRRKLDAAGAGGLVKSIWGVGYRLL